MPSETLVLPRTAQRDQSAGALDSHGDWTEASNAAANGPGPREATSSEKKCQMENNSISI